MYESLTFAKFRIYAEARDSLHLPDYKGSCLRGAFGNALKRVACTCESHSSPPPQEVGACVYHYLFEPQSIVSEGGPRGVRDIPQPFILIPPLEKKTQYEPGEPFSFELVLIGKAIHCLAYFLVAFELMGISGLGKGRGRFQLGGAWIVDVYGRETPLDLTRFSADPSNEDLIASESILQNNPYPKLLAAITLEFLTPTRIKFESHLCDSPEFHVLYRNLSRRIGLLSHYHCGGEWKKSIQPEIEKAEEIKLVKHRVEWLDWRRYSNRQESEMYLGGFIGQLGYRGNFEQFWPQLVLGTHLHLGKGATFGLGKFCIHTGLSSISSVSKSKELNNNANGLL
jgi:hypothetical protein